MILWFWFRKTGQNRVLETPYFPPTWSPLMPWNRSKGTPTRARTPAEVELSLLLGQATKLGEIKGACIAGKLKWPAYYSELKKLNKEQEIFAIRYFKVSPYLTDKEREDEKEDQPICKCVSTACKRYHG